MIKTYNDFKEYRRNWEGSVSVDVLKNNPKFMLAMDQTEKYWYTRDLLQREDWSRVINYRTKSETAGKLNKRLQLNSFLDRVDSAYAVSVGK